MKITIQDYDETVSLEFSDGCELEAFKDHLIRILRVMWLPDQVDEMMGVNDYDEGYDAGYNIGKEDGYEQGLAFKGKKEDKEE